MNQAYVAHFPKLPAEFAWIHSFRAKHDPLAALVPPHITLVFPSGAGADILRSEAQRAARSQTPFRAKFRCAIVMPESASSAYVFLVPDEGFARLVRLHDALYAGALRPELRLDLPFIPHLTIGSGLELELAKELVDEINSKEWCLDLSVAELQVMEVEETALPRKSIATIALGTHADPSRDG